MDIHLSKLGIPNRINPKTPKPQQNEKYSRFKFEFGYEKYNEKGFISKSSQQIWISIRPACCNAS